VGQVVRFLTLTLRHNQTSLKDQLERLYHCYAKLRRSDLWTSRVQAALAFCEVKRSKDGHSWHPHLHVLLVTPWLPQKDLAHRWLAITGDSYIVDVRAISDPEEAARYVCKYATKPFDPAAIHDPTSLDELIRSLKGRRLYVASGGWAKAKLRATPPDPGDWVYLGRLDELISDVQKDLPAAIALMGILRPQQDEDAPWPKASSPPLRITADLPNLWQGSVTVA
jgi:hypothetical protein